MNTRNFPEKMGHALHVRRIGPRALWALLYIVFNTAAFLYIEATGYLMGDADGRIVKDWQLLEWSFFLVTLSIVCLYLLFEVCFRTMRPGVSVKIHAGPLSFVLFVYFSAFVAYVAVTGLFVAGSAERGGDALSAFFALCNVDVLFLVYYAACRETKYFKYVAAIYAVSFVQRGWFAFIYVLIALESFRYIRHGKLKYWHVVVLLALIAIYPLLDAVKAYIRLNQGFDFVQFSALALNFSRSVGDFWTTEVPLIFSKMVGRMQIISQLYIILDQLPYFHYQLAHVQLIEFWKDNIIGVIYDALTHTVHLQNLSDYIALYLVPDLESSWNVNPSLVGWLAVYDGYGVLAFAYVAGFCISSFVIARIFIHNRTGWDTLWFIWLTLLIPGWLDQFVGFVVGMLIFIALNLSINFVLTVARAPRAGDSQYP